jgi:hypothetical protein
MKKIFYVLAIFMFSIGIASATETLKVMAVTPISTEKPSENITVQALEDISIGDWDIMKGFVLYGKMIDVVQPQKYGKNAKFSMQITSYDDLRGVNHTLKSPLTLPYRQQLRPNYERSELSFGNGSGSSINISPYDFKLMKESTSVWDYIKKDSTKDSFWQPGWQIDLKKDDIFRFNLPE